jgi:hypothetical protein
LRPFENGHGVDFAARRKDSRRTRDQESRTDGTRVRAIIRTQINGQPRVDSWLAVPSAGIEIVLHGVKTIEARSNLDGATDIGLTGDDISILKPSTYQCFIMIDQRHIGPLIAPVGALSKDDA